MMCPKYLYTEYEHGKTYKWYEYRGEKYSLCVDTEEDESAFHEIMTDYIDEQLGKYKKYSGD